MLIQLPSGNWIDPSLVRKITAFPRDGENPPHVLLNDDLIIYVEAWEDAEELRDQLAGEVIQAQARAFTL